MKKITNFLAAALAAALLSFGLPAKAQLGGGSTPVANVTIAAGAATNIWAVLDATGGKDVCIQLSYNVSTNYVASALFTTGLTNVYCIIERSVDRNLWNGAVVPDVIGIPGNTVGTNYCVVTNLSIGAAPYLRLKYITNVCGCDANCIVTNVYVKYWVK